MTCSAKTRSLSGISRRTGDGRDEADAGDVFRVAVAAIEKIRP